MKKIRPLRKNGTIGIFSSSGPISRERFELGINNIESLGYKVKTPVDPSFFYGKYDHSFFADSIQRRLDSINELLEDSDVDVLIATRGAYGTQELLASLDYKKINEKQKAIIGMSDVTSLLLAVNSQAELVSIHGATLGSSFADYQKDLSAQQSVDSLIEILSSKEYKYSTVLAALRPANAIGQIVCGNLTLLSLAVGTRFDLDFSDKILIVEDVGEKPYQVQRNLLHLKNSQKLENLAGLVFARFVKCEATNGPSVEEAINYFIRNHLNNTKYPIYSGLSIGHHGLNHPLPLGCLAEIKDNQFCLRESPLM